MFGVLRRSHSPGGGPGSAGLPGDVPRLQGRPETNDGSSPY